MEQNLILISAAIVALGMCAEWLAWRLRIPAIVLFLLTGFLIGPVIGWVNPAQDFGVMLQPLISLSVAIILFVGGLKLRWHEYREAGVDVNRLVSLGLPLTWVFSALAAYFIGGLSWPIALIFGAITVVTGPTVLLPLLKHARLRRRTAALLKWEGIINDPLGAMLSILVFKYFMIKQPEHGIFEALGSLALGLLVAVASGIALGYGLSWAFHRGHIPEYLKPPILLAAVPLLYVTINLVQEAAGLLAVTAMGIVVTNQRLRNIDDLRRFKDYVIAILVAVLFIVLTANIDMQTLRHLGGRSFLLLAVIIFLVRPLAVYLATLGTGIRWQERLLIAWIAPRGIVAASVAGVFASRLAGQGYEGAEQLLPLVFSLIAATVILHGLTIGWLGRRLGLASRHPNGVLIVGASPWAVALARLLKDLRVPVIISDISWHHLHPAYVAHLPIYQGQILSEAAGAKLELNEMSHVLAATANESYNALVCTHFAPEFGRNHVFQLASPLGIKHPQGTLARTVRGRIAFDGSATYEDLMRYRYHGWRFHKIRLTEKYTYADYLRDRPHEALPIATVTKRGQVMFYPLVDPDSLQAGDYVINYAPV